MIDQPPIIQICYQLTLLCYQRVATFPRHLRPIFHDTLSKVCHEVLGSITQINQSVSLEARKNSIMMLLPKIASLRLTLRLARDLKAMSIGQHSELSLMLEDLNLQLLAWQTWHDEKIKKTPPKKAGQSEAFMER